MIVALAAIAVVILLAGDRIAKALGFVIGFTFNLCLILFTSALRLTLKAR